MEGRSDAGAASGAAKGRSRRPAWEASSVRALRRHLRLSQKGMAEELGVRQQTVSEWETGLYRPRGTSARLLTIIADRASFEYETGHSQRGTGEADRGDADVP
jgi:DNA-binding transcriptional regulator YiaG